MLGFKYYTNDADWELLQKLADAKKMWIEQWSGDGYTEPMYTFRTGNYSETLPMNFDWACEYIKEHPNH